MDFRKSLGYKLHRLLQATSSIGRAPVSKTGGWEFDSLVACHFLPFQKTYLNLSPWKYPVYSAFWLLVGVFCVSVWIIIFVCFSAFWLSCLLKQEVREKLTPVFCLSDHWVITVIDDAACGLYGGVLLHVWRKNTPDLSRTEYRHRSHRTHLLVLVRIELHRQNLQRALEYSLCLVRHQYR